MSPIVAAIPGCARVPLAAMALAAALLVSCERPQTPSSQQAQTDGAAHRSADAEHVSSAPTQQHSGVVTVNRDFDRLRSRILVRRVLRPTRANLEFAVYDSNPAFRLDAKPPAVRPPPSDATPSALRFASAFVAGSLVDRIAQTPLAGDERSSAMSWYAVAEMLMEFNYDVSEPLCQLWDMWDTVTGKRPDAPGAEWPNQDIARAYLHAAADGRTELWVSIEFEPWMTFTGGIDDEDGDGFAEVYGKLAPSLLSDEMVKQIASYRERILSQAEAQEVVRNLVPELVVRFNPHVVFAGGTIVDEPQQLESLKAELGQHAGALDEECMRIAFGHTSSPGLRFFVLLVDGVPPIKSGAQ